jgi:hypothetical protein
VCCIGNGAIQAEKCEAPGGCTGGAAQFSCSSPADCPGEVCCAHYVLVNNGMTVKYTGASCANTCGDASSEYIICTGDPSVCTGGTTCQTSELGPGYQVCHN